MRNQRLSLKVTLSFLIEELKEKYKKLAEELDRNFNEYEEIS